MSRVTRAIAALAASLIATAAPAEEIGEIDVDWLGNDIIVEAFEDPEVAGITCYVSYFERGMIDRLQKGNWFEDPSNSAISCQQTGPVDINEIPRGKSGKAVFSERRSIIWKSLKVTRVFDAERQTLVYVAHGRNVQDGSAKMAISTVPISSANR